MFGCVLPAAPFAAGEPVIPFGRIYVEKRLPNLPEAAARPLASVNEETCSCRDLRDRRYPAKPPSRHCSRKARHRIRVERRQSPCTE